MGYPPSYETWHDSEGYVICRSCGKRANVSKATEFDWAYCTGHRPWEPKKEKPEKTSEGE